ncbi:DUF4179 domain-containing protein [Paenibacillus fonticola]|uniref:DUF4179 domain-containing protein n=1 Tax=Paenibacillus fonticola TaxID=379896 RepID=UPI00036774EC|nr:DUF4179 domain-containing protein [Paenibacillus fonticola]
MEQFREHEIKQRLQGEPEPNYGAMWTAIEQEAFNRKLDQSPNSSRGSKKQWISAVVMASCFLIIGVPVFASVALNWDGLSGGKSITTALNQGYGQQYDKQAVSEGVTMGLHGVVADDNKMKLLVSMDSDPTGTAFDAIEFEHIQIADASGKSVPLQGHFQYDEQSGKLLGIYEAPNELKGRKQYVLSAEDLVFYQYAEVPLKAIPQTGQTILTDTSRYPSLDFESVQRSDGHFIVRYNVKASEANAERWDPHLILKTNKGRTDQGMRTILPYEGPGLLIQQEFELSEQEWAEAEFDFSYLHEARREEGSWQIDFEADGKKAAEVLLSRKLLNNAEFEHITGKALQKLIITPLEIRIAYLEDQSMERMKEGSVWYDTVRLEVDGKEIEGVFYLIGDGPNNYQHVYQFSSPEWYKDWSDASLKLILKDPVVTKRDKSKNWVELHQPNKEKQYVEMKVEDFHVKFTYYMDGKDLVVESESDDPHFKGISQTMLRVAGEDVYPQMAASGPNGSGKKAERYENLNISEVLELNPGFYRYMDSAREIEVQLIETK